MRKIRHFDLGSFACSTLIILLLGFLVVGQAQAKTLWGERKSLGKGTARTFVVMNDQGKPVSLGIAFTNKALSGLPSEAEPPEVMLSLPAKVDVRPFKYVVINWNPQGHEPQMYQVPHFDFHFYMIPNEEREKITGNDAIKFAKAPPAEYLPADYMMAPGGIPRMGAHSVYKKAPEFQGKPFTATFIYGTYDGNVTFYEPMVSMSFLNSRPDFSTQIKQPAAFQLSGLYPGAYSIRYDKKLGEYRVSLDGLAFHH